MTNFLSRVQPIEPFSMHLRLAVLLFLSACSPYENLPPIAAAD